MTHPQQGSSTTSFLTGAAFGALAMYLMDPQGGARRRAMARDRATKVFNDVDESLRRQARDIGNRAKGSVAETRARLTEKEVEDQVLVERVRAELGRLTSTPGAVEVSAADGIVTLCGWVPVGELEALQAGVGSVRGVQGVYMRLEERAAVDGRPLTGQGRQ